MILERKNKFDFDNISSFGITSEFTIDVLKDIVKMRQIYKAAMKEISTKLEILDDEFRVKYDHNPIHHMECRIKQPHSIIAKLKKIDKEFTMDAAMKNLNDIAGIRVICNYVADIYTIAGLLSKQKDVELIKEKDYIKNPKSNGYRSLHLIVSVPVFLSEETMQIPVEVQIRTIAMDFWASLEHQLRYKSSIYMLDELQDELQKNAEDLASIDLKMQDIFMKINSAKKD